MAGHALLGLTLWLLGYPDRHWSTARNRNASAETSPNTTARPRCWAGIHHQFGTNRGEWLNWRKLIYLASDQDWSSGWLSAPVSLGRRSSLRKPPGRA